MISVIMISELNTKVKNNKNLQAESFILSANYFEDTSNLISANPLRCIFISWIHLPISTN